MLSGGAYLSDGLEDLLQQGELVRSERVVADIVSSIPVATHDNRISDERQLVINDVALGFEDVA